MIKYIIFALGVLLAALFYTIANFHDRVTNKGILFTILVSLMFATIEYSIKIPLWYYVRKMISPIIIQITWITIITVMVMGYQVFYLKDKPHPISVFLGIISVLLLISIIVIEHNKKYLCKI